MDVQAFRGLIFPLPINCSKSQTNFRSDYSKLGNYFSSFSSKSPVCGLPWDKKINVHVTCDGRASYFVLALMSTKSRAGWQHTLLWCHDCNSRTCVWIYTYIYIIFTKDFINFFLCSSETFSHVVAGVGGIPLLTRSKQFFTVTFPADCATDWKTSWHRSIG